MLANISLAAVALAVSAAAPQAPTWNDDYGKALAETRADDRPLLIVIDQPGAEAEALDPKLVEGANKALLGSYDLCRVDATTEYGQAVAEVFEAKSFPYVAIIDKTGSVILHSQAGDITPQTWKNTLAKFKTGLRRIRHTVAKPQVTHSQPVTNYEPQPTVIHSTPQYFQNFSAPAGDCPNCRRNRGY